MDPQTTEAKLQKCIPHLVQAANSWEAGGLADAPLLIAAGSPTQAAVIRADGWPPADIDCSREQAAAWLIEALQAPCNAEAIVACVSRLLEHEGRVGHLESAATIRQRGQLPVMLFMIADSDTMTATTTAVPRPTYH